MTKTPKHTTYSDGKGGTLTRAQWEALTPEERASITKLVDGKIERLTKAGTL
jgi:hypothetical protein